MRRQRLEPAGEPARPRTGGEPLHLAGTVGRGAFAATVDLPVAAGEVVALLGPNGAGKSTVLRSVAGLSELRAGRLSLGSRVLDDVEAGIFVAPSRRGVGTVFQDHRLFPHLSVTDNVAFGPRALGLPRRDAERTAATWLDRLGVAAFADRRPGQLSGGQAQRVAIARALAASPTALVLDEPLAALDAHARGEVQRALAEHLREFTGACVLVTHDLVDALVLADRMVVLEDGRVVQAGRPDEVLRRPATAYVARLLGMNLFDGTVVGAPAGTRVAVRPSAIRLTALSSSEAAARPGAWSGTVASVTPWGEHVRVEVDGSPAAVVEIAPSALSRDLRPGAPVQLDVDVAATEVYPGLADPTLSR